MKKYGCIGKKLTHSFSKEIHGKLADYNYELIELTEEEITPFFEKKESILFLLRKICFKNKTGRNGIYNILTLLTACVGCVKKL